VRRSTAAVQEFNRYNQRQITIADQSIVKREGRWHFPTTELDSSLLHCNARVGVQAQIGDNNGDIRLSAVTNRRKTLSKLQEGTTKKTARQEWTHVPLPLEDRAKATFWRLIRLTAADVGWPLIGLIVLGLFVGPLGAGRTEAAGISHRGRRPVSP